MSDDVAIRISNVSKQFKLPHEKVNSVKGAFTSMLHRDKSFSTQKALNDISFDIKKGEFFGIVGRNGSGKSTLLKIIAGIYQPTQGSVQVHGKLVPFIELGVGFNPELTGRENVYLNGSILGFSKKQIDGYYDDVVEFAELEQFMDQKLKNYSSGMQVRLAFACATRAEADILLVDEVLAVGDADFQRKCFDYFRELKRHKTTVVFVSHDMNSVKEYCDRGVFINESKLVFIGSPSEIAADYNKLFNESPVNHKDDGGKSKRWGNEQVVIKNPKTVFTDKNTMVEISYDMVANEDVEDAIPGFMIKNAAGEPIMGTNSVIKDTKTPNLKKGDCLCVSWKFPNIFTDGKYYVDPALVAKNGTTYDWWEEATSFVVRSDEKVPYIVNPAIKLNIKKKP